jgi:putative inorganic carbon (HCO3(-)) transporter
VRIDRLRDTILLLTVAVYTSGFATIGLSALLIVYVGELFLRSWRWTRTSLDLPLLALVIAVLASTVASEWRALTVEMVIYFLFAVIVSVRAVGSYGVAGAERIVQLLVVWVAGGVAAAAWALAASSRNGFMLASTSVLNPNTLGTTLAVAVVLGLALMLGGAPGRRRVWAGGMLVLATALVATLARAAWVAAAAGVVTLMLIGGARARAALALGCVLLIAVGWAALPRAYTLNNEVRSITSLEANRYRLFLWRAAPRILADYPILGSGYGTFPYVYPRYRSENAPEPNAPFAHNIFLNFAAETGVLGLVAFVSLCGAGLFSSWRWFVRSPPGSPDRTAATAVLAALVTFLTNQLFDGTALTVHAGFGLLALLTLGAVGDRGVRVR